MNEKDPGIEQEQEVEQEVEEYEEYELYTDSRSNHLHSENVPYVGTDADWWKLF